MISNHVFGQKNQVFPRALFITLAHNAVDIYHAVKKIVAYTNNDWIVLLLIILQVAITITTQG